jgi:hypothetical protein
MIDLSNATTTTPVIDRRSQTQQRPAATNPVGGPRAVTPAAPAETLEQKLARLEAENARLKADSAKTQQLKLKVAEKGGVSLYGLNTKYPVTLYAEQWFKVLDIGDSIRDFIEKNRQFLKWKDAE